MDTYKTILVSSPEILYKEKNSKFFGYAFPAASEDEVRSNLDVLRKNHPSAVHFCYAWQMGTAQISFRANDDGEPGNSAGMPIYGQILSFQVTNILVVVVRYFGGVKLGVGGLISAYRTAAQMAMESAQITELTIKCIYMLRFTYKNIAKVMRVIRESGASVDSQNMEMECEIRISIRQSHEIKLLQHLEALFDVEIRKIQ